MIKKIILSAVLCVCAAVTVHSRAIYDEMYDVKNFRYLIYDTTRYFLWTGREITADKARNTPLEELMPRFESRSVMITEYIGTKKEIQIPVIAAQAASNFFM